ncbi:DUF4962 domain-containing protein [candidate division KSB1 bacterium]|nr:MAG: DUF4962 domain-containing protein [candidate division KSB1 bacterium]
MLRKYWIVHCVVLIIICNAYAESVLLIASSASSGAGPFTSTISTPLMAAGYQVRIWTQSTEGWPPLDTLRAYNAVFFHGSERRQTKSVDSTLTAYMLQGGRLVMEGTVVAQWGCVYPEFNNRITHEKWQRANVTNYTHVVVDSSHAITTGLPATFSASGYLSVYVPDFVLASRGGRRLIGFQTPGTSAAAIVYPRSVFFCDNLHRITTTSVRDSLIVRSVRFVLTDPLDAAVYNLDYELGHRAGETIPVLVQLKNWGNPAHTGQLVLQASIDSVTWAPQDSTSFSLAAFELASYTLNWFPQDSARYYLRALIRPDSSDAYPDDNNLDLTVNTLIAADHPKLFFTAADVPDMRLRATTTHLDFVNALRAYINANISYSPPQPANWQNAPYLSLAAMISNGALLYVLDQSPQYLTFTKRIALALCRYPNWEKGNYDQDFYAAGACFGLALAYDWLYHDFSPAERDTIQTKLRIQLERLDAAWPQYMWWMSAYMHNHGWSSPDNLGSAALAVVEEEPDAPLWLQRAIQNLNYRMTLYGPVADGSWYEAMNYWGLITWRYLPHIYLLREQCGLDYFDVPFTQSLANYRLYGSLPDWDRMVAVNEFQSGEWYGPEDQLALLANEYRDANVQWLMKRVISAVGYSVDGPFFFFFYDPTVPEIPPTRKSFVVPDQDSYFARSDWTSSATFFSLKCGLPCGRHAYTHYWTPGGALGDFSFSHFHPDQNAFTIYYNGRYIIEGPGVQSPYQHTYKSTTILINNRGQIGNGTKGTWPLPADKFSFNPHLADTFATDRMDYVIGDASSVYPADAGMQMFQRHLLYVRPSTFMIVDRLEAAAPSTFTFFLRNELDAFTWNTSRVLISDGSARMTVHVLQPDPWNISKNFDYYYYTSWGGWGARITNAIADTTVRFVTIFQPAAVGSEGRADLLASNTQYTATRIHALSGLKTVALIRYAPLDTVTVDSLQTDANVAVVLWDSTTNTITGVTIKQAGFLRWGPERRLVYSAPVDSNLEWDYDGTVLAIKGAVQNNTWIWAPLAASVTQDSQPIAFSRYEDYVFIGALPIPKPVSELTIIAEADSVRLCWKRVREDISGQPVEVSSYMVFRSVGTMDQPELLAEMGPLDTLFTDTTGSGSTGYPVFYEVRANANFSPPLLNPPLIRNTTPVNTHGKKAVPDAVTPGIKRK